jgi:ferredoxin
LSRKGAAKEPKMAYVITNPCVGTCDTACVSVCPCDCIHGPLSPEELQAIPAPERAARLAKVQLYINPEDCIDCGACAPECPVSAIFLDEDVPEAWRGAIEENAAFFRRR